MAGTARGRFGIYFNTTALGETEGEMGSVLFKNLFEVLEAHPNTTRIALQYGEAAPGDFNNPGTGTDFWDGTNSFGRNAFAVYRWESNVNRTFHYHMLIQWADFDNFGIAPGNPGSLDDQNGDDVSVGIAIAVGDGDNDPWNGTVVNDGTDTKGDPVWKVPTSGTVTHVLPRSNNNTGSRATSREDTVSLYTNNVTDTFRGHIIADDDNLYWAWDDGVEGNFNQVGYSGLYVPRSGLSVTWPLICIRATSWPISQTTRSEGVITPLDGVRSFTWAVIDEAANQVQAPNKVLSPTENDASPWTIFADEAGVGATGYLGTIEEWPIVWRVPNETTNAAATKAAIGFNGYTDKKVLMPWDGASHPKTLDRGRSGTSF